MASQFASVSVVVPCYNSVRTLERAVSSVARQTLRPAELILVNDASTDDTLALMSTLRTQYGENWIQIIDLGEDKGPSGARNAGWNAATQEYIAFLDSDDSWHEKKIEIQLGHMQKNPDLALSAHDYAVIDPEAPAFPELPAPPPVTRATARALLIRNPYVTPSLMLKRKIPERFFETRRYMEDHLLILEIAYSYGPVECIEAPLCFLYKAKISETGLSSNLWAMEKGDLSNYWRLHSQGHLSLPTTLVFNLFSIAKFARRIVKHRLLKSAH